MNEEQFEALIANVRTLMPYQTEQLIRALGERVYAQFDQTGDDAFRYSWGHLLVAATCISNRKPEQNKSQKP